MPKIATNRPKTLGTITKIKPIVLSTPKKIANKSLATNNNTPWWALKNLKKRVLQYTTQTSTKILFQQFKLGAMIFFLGLVFIYGGYQLLEYSLTQEIVFLIGLSLIGGGFFLAMLAQIRMLIGRLIHIFFH